LERLLGLQEQGIAPITPLQQGDKAPGSHAPNAHDLDCEIYRSELPEQVLDVVGHAPQVVGKALFEMVADRVASGLFPNVADSNYQRRFVPDLILAVDLHGEPVVLSGKVASR
jgi:hypothetical protein